MSNEPNKEVKKTVVSNTWVTKQVKIQKKNGPNKSPVIIRLNRGFSGKVVNKNLQSIRLKEDAKTIWKNPSENSKKLANKIPKNTTEQEKDKFIIVEDSF